MEVRTVGILSPGDMGHAVGRALREHGLHVVTCLEGRSDRTRELTKSAGIDDLSSLEEVVARCELVLSIVDPGSARDVATAVAAALAATESGAYFADCNAVSPQTTTELEAIIRRAGGRYVDASIIGPPLGTGAPPRFYASGPHLQMMEQLDGMGIQLHAIGPDIGRASAVKMCYAAMTKGTAALWTALLTAAELMGVSEELKSEFTGSQAGTYKQMESRLPRMPAVAGRWVSEMEQIAATFEQVGVTPLFHQGAAEVYRSVSRTDLAEETPENRDVSRTLEQTIAAIAEHRRPESTDAAHRRG